MPNLKAVELVLYPDDIFIKWDEDTGHGEGQDNDYFEFTGGYVEDPNCSYVRVTSTDPQTEWTIYRVTSSGTLTKTEDCCNEHDAIHLQRNYLDFTKVDDANELDCRTPGQEIEYTLCWENTGDTTFYDAALIDYLPEGVTYDPIISIIPLVIDENYDPNHHTYTWDLGIVAPDDADCVTLTVEVNSRAEPGLPLHNVAEIWDANSLLARAVEDTPVCCYGDPNIIYVDITAQGGDSGISWEHAYSGIDGMQKALARARNSVCEGPYTIYVAQGSYSPGSSSWDSFRLPEGSSVYGGFKTGGSAFEDRNPDHYKTILTGAIDPDTHNDTVVLMSNDTELDETTLLDGFIVTNAAEYGIYGQDVDFSVENCTIENSEQYGIYAENGDVSVTWTKIQNNNWHGIEHRGEVNTINVENSHINNNKRYGVYSIISTPSIKNCVVFKNGFEIPGYNGIYIRIPSNTATLYNNTIVSNKKAGIDYLDSDPNYLQNPDYLDLQNCILWYNNDGGPQVAGLDPDTTAYYCCIEDCNDVPGRYNISSAPGFAYTVPPDNQPDPNNPYHLAWDSLCKDMGNPTHNLVALGDYDIDAEDRICYGRVDIGADEIYSCDDDLSEDDIYHPQDWNADGIINLHEFKPFSRAWLSHDPCDPALPDDPNLIDPNDFLNWNPICDLNNDYNVDVEDLDLFSENWLWIACWKYSQMHRFETAMMEMMLGGGGAGMMSVGLSMESESAELSGQPLTAAGFYDYARMPALERADLVVGLHGIIDFLEIAIQEGYDDKEKLYESLEFLESILIDIDAARKSESPQ